MELAKLPWEIHGVAVILLAGPCHAEGVNKVLVDVNTLFAEKDIQVGQNIPDSLIGGVQLQRRALVTAE